MRRLLLLCALLVGLLSASPAVQPTAANPCPRGCINFAVNVHDVGHVPESADTLVRLADLFAKHGVKGEFYLTGPMVELYLAQRPDAIAKLKSTGMAISYHVRPPHPLNGDFDQPLQGLSGATLDAAIRDYETFALDRATGGLDRTRPGGYALVRDTFGTAPLTVVVPNDDRVVKLAGAGVYKALGAKMMVWYHEEGTDVAKPLVLREGLLVRPSDFSVTRWTTGGGGKQFWWNRFREDPAYEPVAYLERRLAQWKEPRGALVTALIHENNFYRAGPESWTLSYYTGKDKDTPLPPPWDLTPPEASRVRTDEDQAAIWKAYEALVKWSAAHLDVVTAAELDKMPR